MIYGLKIDESWYFCNPERNYAPSWGPVKDSDAFETCLEEFLQRCEGQCGLPYGDEHWEFYSGKSENEIKKNEGTLIVSLHSGNPEALWALYKWCSGRCIGFQIAVDY